MKDKKINISLNYKNKMRSRKFLPEKQEYENFLLLPKALIEVIQ